MPPVSTYLSDLVLKLVPESRSNERLRTELIAACEDILNSHLGRGREPDINHVAELIRRHLSQHGASGTSSLRFTNLLSRLLDQSILEKKNASLQFLLALASSGRSTPASSTYLPALNTPAIFKPSPAVSPTPATASSPHASGKSKAEILRAYRAKMGRPQLPETHLLRDALYLLQGISGKYVVFSDKKDQDDDSNLRFIDDPQYAVSQPTKALIHRLAELGHLYSRVDAFVREREAATGVGMIEQSLCHYLQTQLTQYYRLIAVLESQMSYSQPSAASANENGDIPNGHSPADTGREDAQRDGSEGLGLTLKRLDVWIDEWRLRLRMMSVCVEGSRDVNGGALVNLIHSYTENGDPFVRKFTDELLSEVSKPFFNTLHKWLFLGELHDPFSEFFVTLNPELAHLQYANTAGSGGLSGDGGFGGAFGEPDEVTGESVDGLKLWEGKYQFRQEMLPAFVGEAFGKKIFSTGKSLNFIRYSCHDSDWVETREKLANTGGSLQYSDINGLERSIDTAYSIASQRLFDVFFDKFMLLDHLKALKNYLLLGHGDFADQLMEALEPSLSRPANTLYRHNLTTTLEAAVRTSAAQHDPPDVLRRLDARILEFSHGDLGWDVFTLEYKVGAPLDTVLGPSGMRTYLRLFAHLWRMKRVEGALSASWMHVAGGSRTMLRVPEYERDWHGVRIKMAEMVHFVRQLQAYCHLEVIECSWKLLMDFINKKEGDLDGLIQTHRDYVERLVRKILLISPKAGKEESLLRQLRDVFNIILQFREATENFYNYTIAEAAKRDRKLDTDRGIATAASSNTLSSDALARTRESLQEYGKTFTERVQSMIFSLQGHPDLDCRFLGVRLSFSEFYKTKREHHKS